MENRLRPNELEAVKRLEAAKIIVRGEKGYVWDALEGVKYGRMEYGRLVSMLERIVAGIRAQGSQKQNESLDKNLAGMVFVTGIKRPGQGTRDDWGMWIPNGDLEILVSSARTGTCLVCEKNKAEQRACKMAKILDTMPIDRMLGDGCGYFYG